MATSLPGTRPRSERSAAGRGRPQEKLGDGHAQLVGERPLAAASQLGKARGRTTAGRGGNREQVAGIGQSTDQTTVAQPRPALEQGVGSEEAGGRQADRHQQRKPTGRNGCGNERDQAAEHGTDELGQQDRGQRQTRLESRPGDASRQAETKRRLRDPPAAAGKARVADRGTRRQLPYARPDQQHGNGNKDPGRTQAVLPGFTRPPARGAGSR